MYLSAWRLLLCSCVATGLGLDQLSSAWRSVLERPTGSRGCQGCGARRTAAEQSLPDSRLTAMRIEFIKKQILDKLRLREPPKLHSPLPSLPRPLANGEVLSSNREVSSVKKDVDEFYGETDQVILLPKEVVLNCGSTIQNTSACMLFQLPPELGSEDVQTAELWVYKESTKTESLDHVFLVSEVPLWANEGRDQSRKILNTRKTYAEGWMKLDMTWTVKEWLDYQELSKIIRIECTTCSRETNEMAMFADGAHKSFLAIHVSSAKKNHRVKRNVNCSPGVSECCREELYVSFADIGWDNWILQPQGYHAYFCRGSCTNAPALTVSGSHYNTIIQKLLHRNRQLTKDADLSPCCTATRLSSVQLLYMDGNRTITQKTLPNMVVESCGCM